MRGSGSAGFGAGKAAVVVVVAVWLLTTLLWLTPGLTRPDGARYSAYLPSTYFDRDLLFFDEWAEVRLIRAAGSCSRTSGDDRLHVARAAGQDGRAWCTEVRDIEIVTEPGAEHSQAGVAHVYVTAELIPPSQATPRNFVLRISRPGHPP